MAKINLKGPPRFIMLSIKPKYTKKIFSGEKTWEFRKQIPKHIIKPPVIIYESYPTKRIGGMFAIGEIKTGSPETIWEHCKEGAGISKEEFFKYFNGKNTAYALKIECPTELGKKIPLVGVSPPQNFRYLKNVIPIGAIYGKVQIRIEV